MIKRKSNGKYRVLWVEPDVKQDLKILKAQSPEFTSFSGLLREMLEEKIQKKKKQNESFWGKM